VGAMKKGINIWSFKSGMPVHDCIIEAKKAGFDGIELELAEEGEISFKSTEKELLEIKRFAQSEGVELPSLATGLYWSYPLTSDSEEVRKKAREIVVKQLESAAILEADTILVVPGAVGVDFIPDCPVVDYEVAYERALEAMMELKEQAEKYKVNIGIENVWNKFLLSPLEMRDFIDKIGSPYVGAYLDVGNVILTGYPEHWVRILGKRIKKVHLKDFRRGIGNISGFVDLLAGDVDFPAVVKALKEAGYDGYVTAEMIPPYKHYSDQIIYNTSKSIDRILSLC